MHHPLSLRPWNPTLNFTWGGGGGTLPNVTLTWNPILNFWSGDKEGQGYIGNLHYVTFCYQIAIVYVLTRKPWGLWHSSQQGNHPYELNYSQMFQPPNSPTVQLPKSNRPDFQTCNVKFTESNRDSVTAVLKREVRLLKELWNWV